MIAARAARAAVAPVPPLPAPLSAASPDAALQAALLATPGLAERHVTAARVAYEAVRRVHGEFHWQSLDAEWNRVMSVRGQAHAALDLGTCNPNSVAWWAVKVAELRAYLAAEEGFRATSARLDCRTPSDALAAQPVSTAVQAARLAGLLHPHEPMLTEAVQ